MAYTGLIQGCWPDWLQVLAMVLQLAFGQYGKGSIRADIALAAVVAALHEGAEGPHIAAGPALAGGAALCGRAHRGGALVCIHVDGDDIATHIHLHTDTCCVVGQLGQSSSGAWAGQAPSGHFACMLHAPVHKTRECSMYAGQQT